jgi:glycogen debranching enzyme
MRFPDRQEDFLANDKGYYVKATSSLADNRTRVLKYGETFGVFNRYGDIESVAFTQFGFFHMETRHLSRLSFYLGQSKPLLLNSTIREDNSLLAVDATNLHPEPSSLDDNPQGTIHVFRSTSLSRGSCHVHFRLMNYGLQPVPVDLTFFFDADFADIFEVRGTHRTRHGNRLVDRIEDNMLILAYEGLDGVTRRTRISFSIPPDSLDTGAAFLSHSLYPNEEWQLVLNINCERYATGKHHAPIEAEPSASAERKEEPIFRTRLVSSNNRCNSWLTRCQADLNMLIEGNPEGVYPYAGVPWFSTVFGRDGIITALETLWIAPAIARGVLSYLAETQATKVDPANDAQPGKIIHETRRGEMAETGEVPFRRYYGSVDSTPLFLILAGAYFHRTADLPFLRQLLPNIEAAIHWLDHYADADRDGFYEYARQSEKGLTQQGWKDSFDSVFHLGGRLAEPPIALCEMQGYVYAAKQAIAELYAQLGLSAQSATLIHQAATLQRRFDEAFWNDELGTYVIALDGQKRQCEVRTSNAGHALFTRIATPARARTLSETLFDASSYSGWGIRTVAAREVRYNPMSYHNGSVWPHDNALIGAGFAHYGYQGLAARLFTGMFDAARHMDLNRLPELFCGFHRRPDGTGPTLYPVACAPQAWSSGAPFLLLYAALGIEIRANESLISLDNSHLPNFLTEFRIHGLSVKDARVDLLITRHEKVCTVDVLRKEGEVDIQVRT